MKQKFEPEAVDELLSQVRESNRLLTRIMMLLDGSEPKVGDIIRNRDGSHSYAGRGFVTVTEVMHGTEK